MALTIKRIISQPFSSFMDFGTSVALAFEVGTLSSPASSQVTIGPTAGNSLSSFSAETVFSNLVYEVPAGKIARVIGINRLFRQTGFLRSSIGSSSNAFGGYVDIQRYLLPTGNASSISGNSVQVLANVSVNFLVERELEFGGFKFQFSHRASTFSSSHVYSNASLGPYGATGSTSSWFQRVFVTYPDTVHFSVTDSVLYTAYNTSSTVIGKRQLAVLSYTSITGGSASGPFYLSNYAQRGYIQGSSNNLFPVGAYNQIHSYDIRSAPLAFTLNGGYSGSFVTGYTASHATLTNIIPLQESLSLPVLNDPSAGTLMTLDWTSVKIRAIGIDLKNQGFHTTNYSIYEEFDKPGFYMTAGQRILIREKASVWGVHSISFSTAGISYFRSSSGISVGYTGTNIFSVGIRSHSATGYNGIGTAFNSSGAEFNNLEMLPITLLIFEEDA